MLHLSLPSARRFSRTHTMHWGQLLGLLLLCVLCVEVSRVHTSASITARSIQSMRAQTIAVRPRPRQIVSANTIVRVARPKGTPQTPAPIYSGSTVSTPSSKRSLDTPPEESFPPFRFAVHPVSRIPNWGAMRTPAEWERTYAEMTEEDFVSVPAYNLQVLTTPLSKLTNPITVRTIPQITAKLYYSTHYFGSYDIDAEEFTPEAVHPGIDLKLPEGTPVGAIGGGLVHGVRTNRRLGIHVILEHRIPGEGTFYSIYGHLAEARVEEGERVVPGDTIGTVGMTGNTSAAHIHFQIDRGTGERVHMPYYPPSAPSPKEATQWTVHPITFIQEHQRTANVVLEQRKKR